MGFYIRKSLRVGPLRFNLSKSGVGVSAGIPGFRVGMGPRGNYIHAGRGGIYYRATIPSSRTRSQAGSVRRPRDFGDYSPPAHPTVGPEVEVESGSALEMIDESATGLLVELNEKRQRWRTGPAVLVIAAILLLANWNRMIPVGQGIALVFAIAIVVAAFNLDMLRKTTVMMYELDADATASYQALVDALTKLGEASKAWHIEAKAGVLDRKYHAGAGEEIRRTPTSVRPSAMPFVKCNLDVPSIRMGRQTLFFLPDRLLVFESDAVGAVSYGALSVNEQAIRFVETERVPPDSQVVARTWRYVNKHGGPDRRFNDNAELPICEYDSVQFTSGSGLNEMLYISRVGAAAPLIRYLAIEGARLAAASVTASRDPVLR